MKKQAFSLAELSIVAIIIGILTVGVMQGSNLIKTSRLTNARSLTSKSIVPEINGLVAWFETSLLASLKETESVDGSQNTAWYDVSPSSIVGTKNTLTRSASSAVTLKSNGINELPSLQFNGAANVNFSLANFYQGTSAQNTIFMVFKPLGTVSNSVLLDSSSGNSSAAFGIKSNAVSFNCGNIVDTATGTNPASFSAGNSYIVATYFNGAASQAFVNNAATSAGASTVNAGTNQLGGLTIGSKQNGSTGFDGLISEIIIYNRPLKLQERKDVMKYLSKKYQIEVTGI